MKKNVILVLKWGERLVQILEIIVFCLKILYPPNKWKFPQLEEEDVAPAILHPERAISADEKMAVLKSLSSKIFVSKKGIF